MPPRSAKAEVARAATAHLVSKHMLFFVFLFEHVDPTCDLCRCHLQVVYKLTSDNGSLTASKRSDQAGCAAVLWLWLAVLINARRAKTNGRTNKDHVQP